MNWRTVAVYIRVSTSEQSVAQQEQVLRRWLADRAVTLEVFAEVESSTKVRPILDAMLARVRRREFDAVAVFSFDRFARTARELLMWLDEFRALDVGFVSYSQGLDTSTPMGRAMFTILAALAELERNMISERTKARLDYLRAKGVKLGRPRLHIDMERARRLVLDRKLSIRKLARALGVSSGKAAAVRAEVVTAP